MSDYIAYPLFRTSLFLLFSLELSLVPSSIHKLLDSMFEISLCYQILQKFLNFFYFLTIFHKNTSQAVSKIQLHQDKSILIL